MAEGMMGRGPAPRGRLSDEQRAQIRQVRMDQGRGAARAMRRDMRQEAGLPVGQRQNQMSEMAPPAQQSPMVMGQPTGDMIAFRPMPVQQPGNMQGFDYRPLPPMPSGNPFPQGVAQGVGSALGGAQNFLQNANVRDPGFQVTPEQMQAMRDQYTQAGGQPMPGMKPNFGSFPITDMMYRPSIHGTPAEMQQSVQPQFNANMPAMQPGMNTGFNSFYNRPLGMGAGIANYFK